MRSDAAPREGLGSCVGAAYSMTSCRRAGTPSITLAWTKRRCRPRSGIDIPVLAPDTAGAAKYCGRYKL